MNSEKSTLYTNFFNIGLSKQTISLFISKIKLISASTHEKSKQSDFSFSSDNSINNSNIGNINNNRLINYSISDEIINTIFEPEIVDHMENNKASKDKKEIKNLAHVKPNTNNPNENKNRNIINEDIDTNLLLRMLFPHKIKLKYIRSRNNNSENKATNNLINNLNANNLNNTNNDENHIERDSNRLEISDEKNIPEFFYFSNYSLRYNKMIYFNCLFYYESINSYDYYNNNKINFNIEKTIKHSSKEESSYINDNDNTANMINNKLKIKDSKVFPFTPKVANNNKISFENYYSNANNNTDSKVKAAMSNKDIDLNKSKTQDKNNYKKDIDKDKEEFDSNSINVDYFYYDTIYIPKMIVLVSSELFFLESKVLLNNIYEYYITTMLKNTVISSIISDEKVTSNLREKVDKLTANLDRINNNCYNNMSSRQFRFISLNIPLEAFLYKILFKIPIPPKGCTSIQVKLLPTNTNKSNTDNEGSSGNYVLFQNTKMNSIPNTSLEIEPLLVLFTVEQIVEIFKYILLEQNVLIFNSSYYLLSSVLETFKNLLFPFEFINSSLTILPSQYYGDIELSSSKGFLHGIKESYSPGFFNENNIDISKIKKNMLIIDIEKQKMVYFIYKTSRKTVNLKNLNKIASEKKIQEGKETPDLPIYYKNKLISRIKNFIKENFEIGNEDGRSGSEDSSFYFSHQFAMNAYNNYNNSHSNIGKSSNTNNINKINNEDENTRQRKRRTTCKVNISLRNRKSLISDNVGYNDNKNRVMTVHRKSLLNNNTSNTDCRNTKLKQFSIEESSNDTNINSYIKNNINMNSNPTNMNYIIKNPNDYKIPSTNNNKADNTYSINNSNNICSYNNKYSQSFIPPDYIAQYKITIENFKELFFYFILSILKDYNKFTNYHQTSFFKQFNYVETYFQTTLFINSFFSDREFYSDLVNSNMFFYFIRNKFFLGLNSNLTFNHNLENKIKYLFFDEMIACKDNKNTFSNKTNTPLIETSVFAFNDKKILIIDWENCFSCIENKHCYLCYNENKNNKEGSLNNINDLSRKESKGSCRVCFKSATNLHSNNLTNDDCNPNDLYLDARVNSLITYLIDRLKKISQIKNTNNKNLKNNTALDNYKNIEIKEDYYQENNTVSESKNSSNSYTVVDESKKDMISNKNDKDIDKGNTELVSNLIDLEANNKIIIKKEININTKTIHNVFDYYESSVFRNIGSYNIKINVKKELVMLFKKINKDIVNSNSINNTNDLSKFESFNQEKGKCKSQNNTANNILNNNNNNSNMSGCLEQKQILDYLKLLEALVNQNIMNNDISLINEEDDNNEIPNTHDTVDLYNLTKLKNNKENSNNGNNKNININTNSNIFNNIYFNITFDYFTFDKLDYNIIQKHSLENNNYTHLSNSSKKQSLADVYENEVISITKEILNHNKYTQTFKDIKFKLDIELEINDFFSYIIKSWFSLLIENMITLSNKEHIADINSKDCNTNTNTTEEKNDDNNINVFSYMSKTNMINSNTKNNLFNTYTTNAYQNNTNPFDNLKDINNENHDYFSNEKIKYFSLLFNNLNLIKYVTQDVDFLKSIFYGVYSLNDVNMLKTLFESLFKMGLIIDNMSLNLLEKLSSFGDENYGNNVRKNKVSL